MKFPLWVMGLALTLWGWVAGVPWLGGMAGGLLAAPCWVQSRLAVTDAEFRRALDVCWVLGVGGLLLSYNREPVGSILRTFAAWLPVVLLPGLLVQVWSAAGRIPVNALLPLPSWRRRSTSALRTFDAGPPFVAVCLLSASLAGPARPWFYLPLAATVALALWAAQKRRGRGLAAAIFLMVVTAGGWFVARSLADIQSWVENRLTLWVEQWRRDDRSGSVARTAIGRNGRVGGSSQVVFTVWPASGADPLPGRFRVGAFSAWRDGAWYAAGGGAERVEGRGDEWPLDPPARRRGFVRVELRSALTGGWLALPQGTVRVGELTADSVERTRMGAVRPLPAGGMVAYRADLADDPAWEASPLEEDRNGVPPHERDAVAAIVNDLGLAGREPVEAVSILGQFFAREFRYTTDLKDAPVNDARATTPLGRFLLGHRTGHCEYFATAAVLVLRAAGVSARYVTGYALGSTATDSRDGLRPVRERDAHAWTRVWIDGHWQDFDPTPASWLEAEARGSGWERFWADCRFGLSRWWWLGEKRLLRQAYWLAMPLLALSLWRFRQLRRAAASAGARRNQSRSRARPWPGADSEWYGLAAGLEARGWQRRHRELRGHWQRRLEAETGGGEFAARAINALALHERLRFDPAGLDAADRASLRDTAGGLVKELNVIAPRRAVKSAAGASGA